MSATDIVIVPSVECMSLGFSNTTGTFLQSVSSLHTHLIMQGANEVVIGTPAGVQVLFKPLLEKFHMCFLPGVHDMSLESMNVDGMLASIRRVSCYISECCIDCHGMGIHHIS